MKTRVMLLVIIAIAAVVILGIRIARSNNTAVIKTQFRTLSRLMSGQKQESMLAMAANANRLKNLFTDPCTLSTPYQELAGSYEPSDVAAIAMQARSHFATFELSFSDVKVSFPDPATATANCTVTIRGGGPDPFTDTQELACTLKKVEGKWLFSDCRIIPVMQK